jgi:membrane-associated HD superfamily phosphohydrolase
MLADISEARVRSNPPKNEEEMQALLKDVFDLVMREGSLDNTNLTFKDLKTIQESFIKTLMNSYHPRIQYPEVHPSTDGQKK